MTDQVAVSPVAAAVADDLGNSVAVVAGNDVDDGEAPGLEREAVKEHVDGGKDDRIVMELVQNNLVADMDIAVLVDSVAAAVVADEKGDKDTVQMNALDIIAMGIDCVDVVVVAVAVAGRKDALVVDTDHINQIG